MLGLVIFAELLCSSSSRLTIPIGTIFNNKNQDLNEAISAMSFAMQEHESSNRSQEHVLKFYVDNIDTVDAYKLTKIICKQVSQQSASYPRLLFQAEPEPSLPVYWPPVLTCPASPVNYALDAVASAPGFCVLRHSV